MLAALAASTMARAVQAYLYAISVSHLHDYHRESTCMIYFASYITLRRFPEVVTVLAPRFLN